MSHTVTVDIEIKDRQALAAAALRLGGEVLGEGSHRLFQGAEVGFGVKLPDWLYPIVLTEEGLKLDNYGGRWGSEASLTRFQERYAIAAAKNAAEAQGWYAEETLEGALVIYHPDGGTLTVEPDGTVDAECFEGRSCAEASAPIEEALGRRRAVEEKAEMRAARQHISNGNGGHVTAELVAAVWAIALAVLIHGYIS